MSKVGAEERTTILRDLPYFGQFAWVAIKETLGLPWHSDRTFEDHTPASNLALETLLEVFVHNLVLVLRQPIDRALKRHRFVDRLCGGLAVDGLTQLDVWVQAS